MESLFKQIRFQLEAGSNPARAESMSAYMRHQFIYYGVSSPQRKVIEASLFPSRKNVSSGFVHDFVTKCWEQDQREWKYVALDFAQKVVVKGQLEYLTLFEDLIPNQSWWDTVDCLAPNLLGKILWPHSELKLSKMKDWIDRDNIWFQRSAIILQLKYRLLTDFETLQHLILRRASSKEFFIQKASGWSLREYSKCNPSLVQSFLEAYPLAPLTKREGMKWILSKSEKR